MLRLWAPRMSNRSGIDRIGSPPGGSTLSTSAPCSASSWVAYGPGRQIVRSRTRSPARLPGRHEAARSRMWMAQTDPSPMTWVRPTFAPSIWRSPASPRRWVTTS